MNLVIGYTSNTWGMTARKFALIIFGFMVSLYYKRIQFDDEENETKWFVVNLSKDFGVWFKKRENECGLSLGFIAFFLARNKRLTMYY